MIVIRHGLQQYGETVGNTYDSALVGAEAAGILNPVTNWWIDANWPPLDNA